MRTTHIGLIATLLAPAGAAPTTRVGSPLVPLDKPWTPSMTSDKAKDSELFTKLREQNITLMQAAYTTASVGGMGQPKSLTIPEGPIVGRDDGTTSRFFGIPIAADAGGSNRWKAPQPVTPWTTPPPRVDTGHVSLAPLALLDDAGRRARCLFHAVARRWKSSATAHSPCRTACLEGTARYITSSRCCTCLGDRRLRTCARRQPTRR